MQQARLMRYVVHRVPHVRSPNCVRAMRVTESIPLFVLMLMGMCWVGLRKSQMIVNYHSPGYTSIFGFHVPTKYAAWVELGIMQVRVFLFPFAFHPASRILLMMCA